MKPLLRAAVGLLFLTGNSIAQDIGIAISAAPEQATGICFGDSSIAMLNCAREKCAETEGVRESDCLRVLWCYPMGWTVDIFLQHREGIHWHEYTCGWNDREKAIAAAALKCDNEWLIECSAVQLWDPTGKSVSVDDITLLKKSAFEEDKPLSHSDEQSIAAKDEKKNVTPNNAIVDEAVWVLDETVSRPSLTLYGGPEQHDEVLEFDLSCDPLTRSMTVLIREVGDRFKENQTLCGTVETKGGSTEFCGATIPNGLAGIPDFEGIAVDLSSFNLSGKKTLTFKLDEYKRTFNIMNITEKTSGFTALCRKTS